MTGTVTPGKGSIPRAAGMTLEMWLVTPELGGRIDLSFRSVDQDGKPMPHGLADSERGLPFLVWQAMPHFSQVGELGGFTLATLAQSPGYGAAILEAVLPIMRRVDKLVGLARDESEDLSFGFVAATLASHFQVGRLKVQAQDGTVSEHKRGAAYVTAHRIGEALLAKPVLKAA